MLYVSEPAHIRKYGRIEKADGDYVSGMWQRDADTGDTSYSELKFS